MHRFSAKGSHTSVCFVSLVPLFFPYIPYFESFYSSFSSLFSQILSFYHMRLLSRIQLPSF
ncbi:hypothetical protein LEP1GSC137_2323 [Leptospira borgpetersenii str. Noumea 25]|uniref:Uncharacterized protein n=1 Tax=Leptospira borgpetersenii serovar Ballum TaxID=280505 RepID=A0A0S2IU65_LEPBO|nr:hypothetical protein LBBP_02988 [Leptospira borgpetersenii serovar Ballum]ALO28537.1 hypothetical protein LBBP_04433 [Leptospira borgpetersenii serovar Ballum]EKQ99181.1 hypothetical protein LEP1GSC121_2302 [Leptospira borgpetersenii serovar Castellonis str. 200801910]EMO10317.1 hypothetical protein LEP1GSC137_2323 [Leptospira borgpetersenii str. Noumea 25]OOV42057.1 hypothetical protein B1H38_16525 [Leptospira borgpetersenii serovar Ballum]